MVSKILRSVWLIEPYLVPSQCDTKNFAPHIFVFTITILFLFNILSTWYFQVPVDPQVLENPQVFDSRLRVTWWLKPTWIQV